MNCFIQGQYYKKTDGPNSSYFHMGGVYKAKTELILEDDEGGETRPSYKHTFELVVTPFSGMTVMICEGCPNLCYLVIEKEYVRFVKHCPLSGSSEKPKWKVRE